MREYYNSERIQRALNREMINSSQIKGGGVIGENFTGKMAIDLCFARWVRSLDRKGMNGTVSTGNSMCKISNMKELVLGKQWEA